MVQQTSSPVQTLPSLPHGQGQVLTARDLLDSGHTRATLSKAADNGQLTRLRSGFYWVPPNSEVAANPANRHRAHVVAAIHDAALHGRELVLAGPSAAIWWGLPWVGPAPSTITTTGSPRAHAGQRALIRPIGVCPDDQIVRHQGALVTSVGRTVIDTARLSSDRAGLVVADSALHLQLTTPAALAALLSNAAGSRAVARARWCIAHADARAESPGESISRYAMIRSWLPMPDLQREFTLPDHATVRVDFYWEDAGLIGEFDGASKYRTDARGRSAADVVLAEKWREDALRALGYSVVRWSWADAWQPAALMDRLRARLA